MRRVWVLAAVMAVLVVTVGSARAEVVHDISSQEAFGFDEVGGAGDADGANPAYAEAWELFANTVEGARILGKLDGTRDFEITIKVLPPDQVDDGDEIWGLSVWEDTRTDTNQDEVTIFIIDAERDPVDIAETIYHEMRHVELWLDGDFRPSSSGEGGHNDLHDEVGPGINRFKDELLAGEREPDPIPIAAHPIYDSLADRFADAPETVALAQELGFALDLELGSTPTLVAEAVEIDDYFIQVDLDPESEALLDEALALITSDGCTTTPDATICGAGASGVSADDVLVGMKIGSAIDPAAVGSGITIVAGFESDGDPSNNWPATGPFDPYQGLDRWYEMILDGGRWDLNAWEVGPDGSPTEVDSDVIGAIQGDSAWFLVPGEQLPVEDPRVRVAIAGFDGNPITGITLVDVSGELPSDPPLGLDGSRAGGQVTGSATIGGDTVFSYGPTSVLAGGTLDAEVCLVGADGSPRADQEVFTTLGEPPDAPDATHNSGVTDESGCARMPLAVKVGAGSTNLRFSVGFDAVELSSVIVLDSPKAPEGPPLAFLADIFGGVDLERGPGSTQEFEDEEGDQVNPFFGSPVDQLDSSLPLDWDILWGDWFIVDSVQAPLLGTLVRIEPGQGEAVEPSGYTFYGRYGMAAGVDDRQPLTSHWCSVAVHARLPDRPVTIPASVIDDTDPTANANVWWTAWFGPDGERFTTKTEVNPETRVPQTVSDHSTLGVVQGNEITLMIPGDEIDTAERIVMSASCTPPEFTDYGLHTRDVLVDTDVPPSFFDPAWVFEGIQEPVTPSSVREAIVDGIEPVVDEPVGEALPQPPVVRNDPTIRDFGTSDAGPSTALSVLAMVLGAVGVVAGVIGFRKAGGAR